MSLFVLLAIISVSPQIITSTFKFEVQNKIKCFEDYKSKSGDILSLFYEAYSQDGSKFNSTDSATPLNVVLGTGQLKKEWENVLEGRCPGEQVVAVLDDNLYYIMNVAVVTRLLKPHGPGTSHYGILARDLSGECDPELTIKPASRVTMRTIARIPDLAYLKYSDRFPNSNIPTKVREPGSKGVKVDESEDTVVIGSGKIVPGWELGLVGGCQGERRMIMMNHDMAYGDTGAFRVIPPQAPLVLDVNIISVENGKTFSVESIL